MAFFLFTYYYFEVSGSQACDSSVPAICDCYHWPNPFTQVEESWAFSCDFFLSFLFFRNHWSRAFMAPPGPYSGTSTLALVTSLLLFFNIFPFHFLFLFQIFFHLPHFISISSLRLQVARASAFTFGLVYGSIKLSYLKVFSSTRRLISSPHVLDFDALSLCFSPFSFSYW